MLIKLSGPAHSVWVKWQQIVLEHGNITLKEYMEAVK